MRYFQLEYGIMLLSMIAFAFTALMLDTLFNGERGFKVIYKDSTALVAMHNNKEVEVSESASMNKYEGNEEIVTPYFEPKNLMNDSGDKCNFVVNFQDKFTKADALKLVKAKKTLGDGTTEDVSEDDVTVLVTQYKVVETPPDEENTNYQVVTENIDALDKFGFKIRKPDGSALQLRAVKYDTKFMGELGENNVATGEDLSGGIDFEAMGGKRALFTKYKLVYRTTVGKMKAEYVTYIISDSYDNINDIADKVY